MLVFGNVDICRFLVLLLFFPIKNKFFNYLFIYLPTSKVTIWPTFHAGHMLILVIVVEFFSFKPSSLSTSSPDLS